MEGKVRWVPLESNPEVMTRFARRLGITDKYAYVDVWGLDVDLLACVPKPVHAVLLLFPITDRYEHFCAKEAETLQSQEISSDVFFMKQTIGNACGTIGLLHSIANNHKRMTLRSDSVLARFVADTENLSAADRGARLESDSEIANAHAAASKQGQTEAPEADALLNLHFICFVCVDGCLYELDGRKTAPVNHGASSPDNLLEDSAVVIRRFIEREPGDNSFNVIALVEDSDDYL